MRLLGQYLKPYWLRIGLQMMVKISGTIVELFLPMMLSAMLDDYAPAKDTRGVWLLGGGMLVCALAAWLCNCCANRMSTNVSREVTRKLRHDLFSRITALSAAQQDRYGDASLVSRLTSDTYNVHNMVDRMQRLGVRAPMLLLGGIVVSLMMERVLTLVLVATLPLLALTVYWSTKTGVPLFSHVQEAQDGMVRKIQENMTGARVIRALSRTKHEQNAFHDVNSELAARQKKADETMAVVSPITSFILNAGLAIVVLVGGWRVHMNLSTPGTIIAFLNYFTIILNALLMVTRIFVMYSKGSASARRIAEVMAAPTELEPEDARGAHGNDMIRFDHVSFSYHKTHNNVSDITFSLKKGQTLGIIGPTGSGKSTLLNLILREYDADAGRVIIDGMDVRWYPREELHRKFGVVFQSDFLMADTIRENIRFGRDVSDGAIDRAIGHAQAGFIREKEGGLDHELNVRGRNLSGGQQQRVLISRALSADPQILLLDDCSSALDFRTDRELRRALRANYDDSTVVIVAQRVSSVMAADLILVMDTGRIIGRGTHDELIASCPEYRELCRIQLGGEAV